MVYNIELKFFCRKQEMVLVLSNFPSEEKRISRSVREVGLQSENFTLFFELCSNLHAEKWRWQSTLCLFFFPLQGSPQIFKN